MKKDSSWKLALVIDDVPAIKVAAAYYSLPRQHRGDIGRISTVSGVVHEVAPLLFRLESAGLLGHSEPPDELVLLINAYCKTSVSRITHKDK